MKAAQINEYGGQDKVQVVEVEKPTPSRDQVLIEVHASSLNPFDTMVREGYVKAAIKELPVTLGGDVAGVVTEIGGDVSNVAVGDKVYGQANAVAGNSGAFAQFAATKASQLSTMPSNMDFAEAAAVVLTGVSAQQALVEHIGLKSGETILIHGGSGGIGSIAVQIAKHLGAKVIATAPTDDVDVVKQLGADEVIDYKTQDFTKLVKDIAAVFDTAGGEVLNNSLPVMKPGGRAVSMIADADAEQAAARQITTTHQMTKVSSDALTRLRDLIEQGVVVSRIDQTFPLAQIREAFKAREAGAGKIAIQIA